MFLLAPAFAALTCNDIRSMVTANLPEPIILETIRDQGIYRSELPCLEGLPAPIVETAQTVATDPPIQEAPSSTEPPLGVDLTCADTVRLVQEGKTEAELLALVAQATLNPAELECFRSSGVSTRVLVAIGQRIQTQQGTDSGPEFRKLSYYAWQDLLNVELILTTPTEVLTGVLVRASVDTLVLNIGTELRAFRKEDILSVQRVDRRIIRVITLRDVQGEEDIAPTIEERHSRYIPEQRRKTGTGLLLGGGAVAALGIVAIIGIQSEGQNAIDDIASGNYDNAPQHYQRLQGWTVLGYASGIIAPPMLLGGTLMLTIPVKE